MVQLEQIFFYLFDEAWGVGANVTGKEG